MKEARKFESQRYKVKITPLLQGCVKFKVSAEGCLVQNFGLLLACKEVTAETFSLCEKLLSNVDLKLKLYLPNHSFSNGQKLNTME